jgi:hypothetical protein
MSPDDFRRIALGMDHATEGSHMGHPDFRIDGRIFATLHHDRQTGMVKLTLDQQQTFVQEHQAAFVPEKGTWGRQGYTSVRLDSVDEDTLGAAMTLAWQNIATTQAARPAGRNRPAGRPRASRTH